MSAPTNQLPLTVLSFLSLAGSGFKNVLFAPFLSALIYPLGSLWTQQAQRRGAHPWWIALLGNFCIAICFLPLLLWRPDWPDWSLILWPVLTGGCFFVGQMMTVLAYRSGDVSVIAPIMGCKTIFVALYSWASGIESLSPILWLAAVLTVVAVYLIGSNPKRADENQDRDAEADDELDSRTKLRTMWLPICFAILATASFAGVDTTISAHGTSFGPEWMLLMTMASLCGFSLLITPLALRHARPTLGSDGNLRSIVFANLAFGAQALILNIANALFAQPTAINIVYSARGLTGIVAVWFIGHWFGNRERQEVPKSVMVRRCIGALLLTVAIVIVVTL